MKNGIFWAILVIMLISAPMLATAKPLGHPVILQPVDPEYEGTLPVIYIPTGTEYPILPLTTQTESTGMLLEKTYVNVKTSSYPPFSGNVVSTVRYSGVHAPVMDVGMVQLQENIQKCFDMLYQEPVVQEPVAFQPSAKMQKLYVLYENGLFY